MAKYTKNIGLPITEDPNLRFAEWWRLINATETLDNKPSAFQIIDKAIGEKVEIKENIVGGWQGTAIPTGEYVEEIFFNTSLTVEETVQLLETLNIEQSDDGFGDMFGQYVISVNSDASKAVGVIKINNLYTIAYGVGDNQVFVFASEQNNIAPVGWNTENTSFKFQDINLSGDKNSGLSSMLSTTQFTRIQGQQGGIYFDKELGIAANVQANENELEKMQNIKIGNQTFKMGDSEYTNLTPTTSTVGGIEKGTTFEKKSIQEVLNMLLYPHVKVSGSFSTYPSGSVYEKGQEITVTSATVKIKKGSSEVKKIEIYDGSTVIASKTSDIIDGNNVINLNYTIYADKVLVAKATDADNKTATIGSVDFDFVEPYYFGGIEVDDVVTEELIKNLDKAIVLKGSHSFPINLVQQKAVIACPCEYNELQSIVDTNNFDVIGAFNKEILTINNVDYYVYVLDSISTISMNYTIRHKEGS